MEHELSFMKSDPFLTRIKARARANQLCIALGSRFSGDASLPKIAQEIKTHFAISIDVEHEFAWFKKWNELIDLAEKAAGRQGVVEFVKYRVDQIPVSQTHRKVAAIPVSNFIDVSLDRRLITALKEGGRDPILHEFLSGFMGSWR